MCIKKIVMEVLCLEPDAQDVAASLTDDWFPDNEFPLTGLSVKIREASADESDEAREQLCEIDSTT